MPARSGGGTTEGKRRQRERGKEIERVTGIKGHQSGSSGVTGLVAKMQRRSYEDIADVAVHGCDIAGQVTDIRMLANRSYSISIIVPAEYAHEVTDLVQDSALMFTMFRSYHVPRGAFIADDEGDEGGDAT